MSQGEEQSVIQDLHEDHALIADDAGHHSRWSKAKTKVAELLPAGLLGLGVVGDLVWHGAEVRLKSQPNQPSGAIVLLVSPDLPQPGAGGIVCCGAVTRHSGPRGSGA